MVGVCNRQAPAVLVKLNSLRRATLATELLFWSLVRDLAMVSGLVGREDSRRAWLTGKGIL